MSGEMVISINTWPYSQVCLDCEHGVFVSFQPTAANKNQDVDPGNGCAMMCNKGLDSTYCPRNNSKLSKEEQDAKIEERCKQQQEHPKCSVTGCNEPNVSYAYLCHGHLLELYKLDPSEDVREEGRQYHKYIQDTLAEENSKRKTVDESLGIGKPHDESSLVPDEPNIPKNFDEERWEEHQHEIAKKYGDEDVDSNLTHAFDEDDLKIKECDHDWTLTCGGSICTKCGKIEYSEEE